MPRVVIRSRPTFQLLTILAVGLISLGSPSQPDAALAGAPLADDLRISQVYGGGGNSGATYTNDFIELFNAGASIIDLTGFSVQYASSSGTSWQVTALAGTIAPGGYYLVQEAQGAGGTTPLPTPDAVGTIAMSGTSGKVALVDTTTALSGACPAGPQIADFVGYGSANCFEGTGAAPGLSNTTAALRAADGCTDTDDNAADFAAGAPNPRNTASPANPCGGDLPPAVTGTNPADGAVNVAVDATVDVSFSEPVTITGTVAVDCTSGVQNVTPTGGPTTFALPHADFLPGDVCAVTILASQVTDQDGDPTNMTQDYSWSFDVAADCSSPSTPIHDIQGNGPVSPLVGQTHSVDGVVVADLQGVSSIRGFFVEEPDADHDADPETSEGLFIYDNGFGVDVAVGDLVRVTGTVSEFQEQTQLSSISAILVCPTSPGAVTPVAITLPFAATTSPERFEGMSVTLPQALTVSDNFGLGRGGILTLSDGRLQQPTDVVLPGAPAIALQEANDRNQITLDDGSLLQNPDPIIYPPPELTALNTARAGDEVTEIAGVLTQGTPGWSSAGVLYRIHPAAMPTFTAANPRPPAPAPLGPGGPLKVSSFNLLNYFLTTADAGSICGPAQNQSCRGASTAAELTRQRGKLLAALDALDADVLGLLELENTPGVEPLADLVNGLNALAGAGTYAYVATGTIVPGGDAIRVGLIYKPAVVQPVGSFALLDGTVDPSFDTSLHRPSLAQTFEEVATPARFTVAVNHFKSKGGCPADPGDPNADQGDGQGCWNPARTAAATAVANWLATDPTASGDPDFLILGDLNAYAMEDPVAALEGAGYTDLEGVFEGPDAYSYSIFGQAGSIDHSLASASLLPQITSAFTWHINADEPGVLDYNVEFKSAGQVVSLYNADAYRSSDHDPLLISLSPTFPEASITLAKTVGVVPGVCATTSTIEVTNGTEVFYCYEVTNTGDFALDLHTLVDSELGTIFTDLPYALAPGASVTTVDASLSISAVMTATTVNTATWTAQVTGGPSAEAMATATVTVVDPDITVAPPSLFSAQLANTMTMQQLSIGNVGAGDLNWTIDEDNLGGTLRPLPPMARPAGPGDAAAAAEPEGTIAAHTEPPPQGAPAATWRTPELVLYDNGPLVNSPGTGAGGADESVLQTVTLSMTTLGFGSQLTAGNRIADDFEVTDPSGWFVDTITFFAYQTGSSTTSTVTGLNLQIWDGPPDNPASTVVWGDTASNIMSSTAWSNIYRVTETTTGTATNRPIMAVVGTVNTLLPQGTYWLDWQYDGTLASGPWAPPITINGQATTGNALQWTGAWAPANDGGSLTQQGFPFVVEGLVTPTACLAPADIPWLSLSPTAGTTAPAASTPVDVTFDSSGIAVGTYDAALCVVSNDPDQPLIVVPVTMEVVIPVELQSFSIE